MSWCSRRSLVLGLAALPACGFTPAYGPANGAGKLFGATSFKTPKNGDEFDLVSQFERRLGRSDTPRFALDWSLSVSSRGTAITSAQETTRVELTGTLNYTLFSLPGRDVVARGQVRDFTGYARTGTTAAARTNESDARRRLMIILADEVVTELLALP